jgi:GNAT superfamily N-acetyltransferase
MLRKTDNALGEIKRLWVCPSARGLGVAGALMGAAEKAAKELGVERLRLDTNRALTEALAMYRAWGWRETQRFNSDPYADFFFEKEIPEVDVQSASRGRPGEPFGIAVQQPSLKP